MLASPRLCWYDGEKHGLFLWAMTTAGAGKRTPGSQSGRERVRARKRKSACAVLSLCRRRILRHFARCSQGLNGQQRGAERGQPLNGADRGAEGSKPGQERHLAGPNQKTNHKPSGHLDPLAILATVGIRWRPKISVGTLSSSASARGHCHSLRYPASARTRSTRNTAGHPLSVLTRPA
ncbi:hypothetical protein ANO11243_081030 [Dothideomycetidae sp. 11243]|nr:hypothetical protein ANO11243_081030 [fungal sp. No.11243]